MSNKSDRLIPMSKYESVETARYETRERSLESLQRQLEVLDWFKTEASKSFCASFLGLFQKINADRPEIASSLSREDQGKWMHHELVNTLKTGATYHISRDMCEMIEHAVTEMPSTGLTPETVPSPTGFLYLAQPYPLRLKVDNPPFGPQEEAGLVMAFGWQTTTVGLREDPSVIGSTKIERHQRNAAGVALYAFTSVPILTKILNANNPTPSGDMTQEDVRYRCGPLPLWDFSGWAFHTPWNTDPAASRNWPSSSDHPMPLVDSVVDQYRRYLLAAWMLLNQKITTVEPLRPPRFLRRQFARHNPEPGDILIVRLRRENNIRQQLEDAGESGEGWWTHRWVVKGHWHPYWIGARNDPARHLELRWIEPYIKGPDGLPLVVKDKVFSLEK